MNGDLTKDCLPDVLRRIYLERLTGVLKLIQVNQYKVIYFELGTIVFASSNDKEDRLGESMMRYGMLTQSDFDIASATITRGKRFGQVLVELGMCTDQDLEMNVTFQILDIIYSLFEWTSGTYEFVVQGKCVPEDLRLDLSTASMILEGVRRIKDFAIIQRGLGDLNWLVGPTTNPLLRLQTLSLKPLERQVIEIVKEPMPMIQVLKTASVHLQANACGLYGLLSAGVLERLGAPKINRRTGKLKIPQKLYEQAAQALPIAPPETAPSGPGPVSSEVMDMLYKMRERVSGTSDPYEILGVSMQSSGEEIREAYHALAKDFHPDRYQGASLEIRQEVNQIFIRLTSSFEIVRAQVPVKPPTAQLPPPRPVVTGPLKVLPETPPHQAIIQEEPTAQKEKRAEQMFMDARNRFLSKDFHIATQLMKEAVRLVPTQGRYHLLLGNILANQFNTLREAETSLRKAVELDPFNAICHSCLGQLYIKAGMKKQAEHEFEEALKLDPTHKISLREMEKLKGANEGGFLNRLFK